MQQDTAQLSLFERLWAWFETNKKQAIWGICVVALVAFLASFYFWRQAEREVRASEALTQAEVDMVSKNGSRVESPDAYLKIVAEYPGTKAAGRALLQAGAALFAEEKYAEAQAQFERFSKEYANSTFLPEATLGVAACLDADACPTLRLLRRFRGASDEQILADHVKLHEAQLALARIHQSQGKLEQALLGYEKLAQSEGPNSSIGYEAGLRAEELKEKMPAVSTNELPTTFTAPQILLTNPSVVATN